MVSEDIKNWETQGSAILGKNQLFINPEVKQRQGLVFNTVPLAEEEWIVDFQVLFGNAIGSTFGTNGMGIFFLSEILSKEIDPVNMFGYSNDFIGAAIYLNSGLRKRDPSTQKRVEGVQGVVSQGGKAINYWEIPTENTCFFKYRVNKDENGDLIPSTIRAHYNHKVLDVLYFDLDTQQYKHCFKLEVDFTEGMYIAISGASGVWDEDYHIVKSIKTMNPNKIDKTHHDEQVKLRKGEKYMNDVRSQDLMHKNRLKYNGIDDLIKKLNYELTMFTRNSEAIKNYLLASQKTASKEHSVDLQRIHSGLETIMQDFFIIDKMFNYTKFMISHIENMPLDVQGNLGDSQIKMQNKISELELMMNGFSSRIDALQRKIQSESDDKKRLATEQERKKRQQMSESRVNEGQGIPSSFISDELNQQIERSKTQIKERASDGYGWFKTLITWVVLVGILYFTFNLWKNLKATEEKFKL